MDSLKLQKDYNKSTTTNSKRNILVNFEKIQVDIGKRIQQELALRARQPIRSEVTPTEGLRR